MPVFLPDYSTEFDSKETIGTIEVIDELVSFAWSVDWVQCQKKKVGEFIQSPCIYTLSNNGKILTWRLQLYPDGINRKCHGSLSLYLRTAEKEKPNLQQTSVTFHLINSNNDVMHKVCGEVFSQFHRDTCGLDRFIRKDVLENNGKEMLNYGKLTIVCTLIDKRTESKFNTSQQPACQLRPQPPPRKSLGDQTHDEDDEDEEYDEGEKEPPKNLFEAMLKRGSSDVNIAVADKTLYAHRAILCARSPFFQSLFEQDIAKRNRVSTVNMNEFAIDVVIELLRYTYLNHVDKLEERAYQLLAPANKYALQTLKDQCEEVMIKNLSVVNASEYLVLAYSHEASKLEEKAMDFVVENSLDVVNTPGFKSIAGVYANVIAALMKNITVNGKKGAQNQLRKSIHDVGTNKRKVCEEIKAYWENKEK